MSNYMCPDVWEILKREIGRLIFQDISEVKNCRNYISVKCEMHLKSYSLPAQLQPCCDVDDSKATNIMISAPSAVMEICNWSDVQSADLKGDICPSNVQLAPAVKSNTQTKKLMGKKAQQFLCLQCNQYFRKLGLLRQHITIHADHERFQSGKKYCSASTGKPNTHRLSFLQQPSLPRHQDTHMPASSTSAAHQLSHARGNRCIACPPCEHSGLKENLFTCGGNTTFCCQCSDDGSFLNGTMPQEDRKDHRKSPSVRVPYVKLLDVSSSLLNRTSSCLLRLPEMEPFHCLVCGKTFSLKASLKVHQLRHDIRHLPYLDVCTDASLPAKRPRLDTLSSSDGKVYLCRHCNKSYVHRSGLRKHHMNYPHHK